MNGMATHQEETIPNFKAAMSSKPAKQGGKQKSRKVSSPTTPAKQVGKQMSSPRNTVGKSKDTGNGIIYALRVFICLVVSVTIITVIIYFLFKDSGGI